MDQPRRPPVRLRAADGPPAEAYGVATFYAMFSTERRPPTVFHVCDDIACERSRKRAASSSGRSVLAEIGRTEERTWMRSPCLGMCELAPAALVQAGGDARRAVGGDGPDSMRVSHRARSSRRALDARQRLRAATGDRVDQRTVRLRSCDASASWIRSRSTTIAPTVATKRCGARSSWAPRE